MLRQHPGLPDLSRGQGGHGEPWPQLLRGCGPGSRLLGGRGCRVTGLDPSASMIAQARELDVDEGVEVEYVQASAENSGSLHI